MADTISTMQACLAQLSETITAPQELNHFEQQMNGFKRLFSRFVNESKSKTVLDWDKIKTPSAEKIVDYKRLDSCPTAAVQNLLSKLVVLKLNGGLGTTMGCTGPKSAIEVRDDNTFLDLTVKQIEYLNATYNVNVPLILMNSFNTEADTYKIIQKYRHSKVSVLTFNQKCYPRIVRDTLTPLPKSAAKDKMNNEEWFPPGHGDVYDSLYRSELFAQLKQQGKEYIFIANIDNLGATVDLNILNHLVENDIEFCMEVTKKTLADVKGGTLMDYDGKLQLLELAQVPKGKVEEFKSISKFKIFNTNNLWAKISAIEEHINDLDNLEIIINNKVYNGTKVIQLETACGAAIGQFDRSIGLLVDRSRFLPVKSCSDLLVIQSNLYALQNGRLVVNPQRVEKFGLETPMPTVRLGPHFAKISSYLSRFQSIPNLLELDSLTVSGDVVFGPGVAIKGSVVIVANDGSKIDIPQGAVLENKVITGGLVIRDHV